jgi:hypothetical protein
MNVVKAILDRLIDLNGITIHVDLGGGSFGNVSKIFRDRPFVLNGTGDRSLCPESHP